MEHSLVCLVSLFRTRLSVLLFAMVMLCPTYAESDNLLIFTGKNDAFKESINGLKSDYEGEFNFPVVIVNEKSTVKEAKYAVNKYLPKAIILIGNKAINLYGALQKEHPKLNYPPSVALAALYVDETTKNIHGLTGIRYEIPIVTGAVNIRSLMKKPLKRIGVIYRAWMKNNVEENRRYCLAEGIEMVTIELPNKSDDFAGLIKKALKEIKEKDIHALWILNDNELLNGATLGKAWIPELMSSDIPVVVGVRPLLSSKLNFGTFAMVPDHFSLGTQAASIISDLIDSEWQIPEREIQQPFSVKKLVNVYVMKKKSVKYEDDKLNQMDEVIKE